MKSYSYTEKNLIQPSDYFKLDSTPMHLISPHINKYVYTKLNLLDKCTQC